jgi:hypothetical protein
MEVISQNYSLLTIPNEEIRPKTKRLGHVAFADDEDESSLLGRFSGRNLSSPSSARKSPSSSRVSLVKKPLISGETTQKTVDSILEIFEFDFPLKELKKLLNLDIESPDLLLDSLNVDSLRSDERVTFSFHVDLLEFTELTLGYNEEIFGSATIFEFNEKTSTVEKISETFNFIVSHEKMVSCFYSKI